MVSRRRESTTLQQKINKRVNLLKRTFNQFTCVYIAL